MTELDKLKLPVPNPYGKMVRIERVNMLIERAYWAGLATARAEGQKEEQERIDLALNDLDVILAMIQSTTEDTPHAEMIQMIGSARKELETLTTKEHHDS